MRKKRFLISFVFLFLVAAGSAWADQTQGADGATKLARGVQNVAFGWFDILNEVAIESDRRGPVIGLPSGLLRGVVIGLGRTVAGVFEVITFPFPNDEKKGDYGPVVVPESVFKRR